MDKKPFPERLTSERVVLKKHDLSLAQTMFTYVDRDRERLRVFLPWVDLTRTVEDELVYLRKAQQDWADGMIFDYGIFNAATGVYMGNAGVHTIRWEHDCCELGYWVFGDFERKGFVSEAVTLIERTCYQLGFHRIEIRCNAKNERSASVPRRLGYQLDGVLRGNAVEHGHYRDTLVFGKLNPSQ
jgi:ribosomal-protein-serine acetyltransferase